MLIVTYSFLASERLSPTTTTVEANTGFCRGLYQTLFSEPLARGPQEKRGWLRETTFHTVSNWLNVMLKSVSMDSSCLIAITHLNSHWALNWCYFPPTFPMKLLWVLTTIPCHSYWIKAIGISYHNKFSAYLQLLLNWIQQSPVDFKLGTEVMLIWTRIKSMWRFK